MASGVNESKIICYLITVSKYIKWDVKEKEDFNAKTEKLRPHGFYK